MVRQFKHIISHTVSFKILKPTHLCVKLKQKTEHFGKFHTPSLMHIQFFSSELLSVLSDSFTDMAYYYVS
jgi:hypothetical protein